MCIIPVWFSRQPHLHPVSKPITNANPTIISLQCYLDALTYGEINIEAFDDILRSLPVERASSTFMDIGSGTGKAVFVAACSGFQCVLIET